MSATVAAERSELFGHPRGLATLFLTEMCERFSFYGMQALLVLFMTDQLRGGFGLDDQTATAIYGLYTAFVYLVALPGGWIADRLWGARRAIFIGGIIIMCGHFVLAVPGTAAFFAGLMLVVFGTGLLKPNVSAIVGELYAQNDPRRDAGFTVFYMGINIGADGRTDLLRLAGDVRLALRFCPCRGRDARRARAVSPHAGPLGAGRPRAGGNSQRAVPVTLVVRDHDRRRCGLRAACGRASTGSWSSMRYGLRAVRRRCSPSARSRTSATYSSPGGSRPWSDVASS